MLAYWLLGLEPVLAVAYLVWAYRKKAAAKAAARSERFERLFGALPPRVATADAASNAGEVAALRSSANPASGRAPSYVRKERLLNPHQAQLFQLLKKALPDHEVLAPVSLAAMIEVPPAGQGREREQRLRAPGAARRRLRVESGRLLARCVAQRGKRRKLRAVFDQVFERVEQGRRGGAHAHLFFRHGF